MEALGWEAYLALKKIDAAAYRKGAPEQYALFEQQFLQMHPESFTAHKLFLLNDIRRTYPLLSHQKESK
ncbi:hypothetical protein [Cesiribacter andamanensis]|uniref:Uncharacterized protein n=1 Tax=Cesiribacter andamanensis AMV16 TaxID=1279009 RepID=M7N7E0_9BACT|nr:hypothetical protein [Cesiribacter andamanensis]EMR04528.1 hypothetical protein ADICEAN_00286 [Cesiribacter andamanensis AMV16]